MVGLCTAIGLFLGVLGGHPGTKLVYSFAIGMSCWLLIDGTRLAIAYALDRARRRRGLPAPARPGFEIGWAGMIPLIVLGLLLGPLLGTRLADALTGGRSAPPWDLAAPTTQITLAVTLLATLVSLVVLTALERAAALRTRAEAAQREAAETELQLLQSQLEPHMLFNTLANLRVLIGSDPARAQAMLDRLIGFLRATLSASRRPSHPLADEFARVADYLALMAVRMGPRLQTRLDLPPALAALPVPPLLLQPLVENAIKHGLEPQAAGGRVEVSARRTGDRLHLVVRDTGRGLDAGGPPGTQFGLAQIRQRLRAIYGQGAALTVEPAEDAEGGTVASVSLPATAP